MNIGTATDYIKDLQEENGRLHQAIANLCNEMVLLESERDQWRTMSQHLYNGHKGIMVHKFYDIETGKEIDLLQAYEQVVRQND